MLSETLKNLRIKQNVTQEHMANLLSIKRQTYSAYERGVCSPDIVALTKMADFFGVTIDYLLGHKNNTCEHLPVSGEMKYLTEAYYDLTEEELKKVIEYIQFLKSKRK